jgi:hypothetical protein
MFRKLFALSAIALPLVLAGCSHPRPVAYYPPPPPPGWSEIARQGFHDGTEAGRHDIASGWAPDAERHPRFRRPPVPPPAQDEFRRAFRDGYDQVYQHGGPPPGRY